MRIPIQQFLKNNPLSVKELLPTSVFLIQHEKNIVKRFKELKAKLEPNELIGFSYNYINNERKGKPVDKSKASNRVSRLLNVKPENIIKGKTCIWLLVVLNFQIST